MLLSHRWICLVMFGGILGAQQPQSRLATTSTSATSDAVQVRPLSPDMTRRYTALSARVQPSAKSWIQQRARLESQKNNLDLTTLKADAKSHFLLSNANLQDADIEALAFLVLMDAAKSAEEDLKSIMAQVKAINNSKAALRDTINDVNRESAALGKANPATPCNTPLCRSLAARISQIQAQQPAAASSSSSSKIRRVQIRPNLTYADLNTIQGDLKSQLDSMSEMGETESLRLQMAMDRRSRFMDALSNLMKQISETSDSVVRNIK